MNDAIRLKNISDRDARGVAFESVMSKALPFSVIVSGSP